MSATAALVYFSEVQIFKKSVFVFFEEEGFDDLEVRRETDQTGKIPDSRVVVTLSI